MSDHPAVAGLRALSSGRMKPALIITHLEDRDEGLAREELDRAGCAVIVRHAEDRDTLPSIEEISGVVSLGGNQSATRVAEDPFLTAELSLLHAALTQALPTLGICLGAQLIAVAAGGAVGTMARIFAGWPALTPRPALAADAVFGGLRAGLRVLKWHEDTIDLPAGAAALADTPGPGAGLFRIGAAAWGSQAHLEVTPRMLFDAWLAEEDGIAQIRSAGRDPEDFRAESEEWLPPQMAAARPVFAAFAGLVRAPAAR